MGRAAFGNVEAETGCQKRPGHIREGEKEERSTAEGVNGEERWPREHEVDEAKPERRDQSLTG